MSLNIITDVWDSLRYHIQPGDRDDAASALVNLLIDNDYDAEEIKEAFRGDKEIVSALSYFTTEQIDEEDYEDWEEDQEEW